MHPVKLPKQSGLVHIPILIAVIALIGFIFVSSSADFKSKLFARLYPNKPQSKALESVRRIEFFGVGVSADKTITTSQTVNINAYYIPQLNPSPASSASSAATSSATPSPTVAPSPTHVKLSNTQDGLNRPCPSGITCTFAYTGDPTVINAWRLTDGFGSKTVYAGFLKNDQPLDAMVTAAINYQLTPVSSPTSTPGIQTVTNNEPEFVKGEFIVKLKSSSSSRSGSLEELDRRYGVISKKDLNTGQVFTVSQRLTLKSAEEFQNKAQEIKIKYPERAERNSRTTQVPDLSNIYLYKLSNENANIPEIVRAYKNHPDIEYATPNNLYKLTYVPNDYHFATLWGLRKINAPQAWDLNQGEGVIVAVVDSGVDSGHEDLTHQMWNNPGEVGTDARGSDKRNNNIDDDRNGYVDDVEGAVFGTCLIGAYITDPPNLECTNPRPIDYEGHGTHVAGIIAAEGNNQVGVIGVAPRVKIMAIKAIGRWISEADLYNAFLYVVDKGADVMNNSWGCGRVCDLAEGRESLTKAVKYAYSMGVVSVFAAGNNNGDIATYGFPAGLIETISVGSTDVQDQRASSSNFGNIDVTAPGENILSARSMFPSGPWRDPKYLTMGGTSMAAPHVSGLAALLLSRHPTLRVPNIKQIIRNSADDLGDPGWDRYYGAGRINALRALQLSDTYFSCQAASSNLNRDGVVNILDFSIYATCLTQGISSTVNGVSCQAADINRDGVLDTGYDQKDLQCLGDAFNKIVPTSLSAPAPTPTPAPVVRPPYPCRVCRANVDRVGVVNRSDLGRLQACFNKRANQTDDQGRPCANADVNGDGVVTILDFSCLASKFNQSSPSQEANDPICRL